MTLSGCEGKHRPGGKYWQPTIGFMTMSPNNNNNNNLTCKAPVCAKKTSVALTA